MGPSASRSACTGGLPSSHIKVRFVEAADRTDTSSVGHPHGIGGDSRTPGSGLLVECLFLAGAETTAIQAVMQAFAIGSHRSASGTGGCSGAGHAAHVQQSAPGECLRRTRCSRRMGWPRRCSTYHRRSGKLGSLAVEHKAHAHAEWRWTRSGGLCCRPCTIPKVVAPTYAPHAGWLARQEGGMERRYCNLPTPIQRAWRDHRPTRSRGQPSLIVNELIHLLEKFATVETISVAASHRRARCRSTSAASLFNNRRHGFISGLWCAYLVHRGSWDGAISASKSVGCERCWLCWSRTPGAPSRGRWPWTFFGPTPTPAAANSLNQAVFQLRRAIELDFGMEKARLYVAARSMPSS